MADIIPITSNKEVRAFMLINNEDGHIVDISLDIDFIRQKADFLEENPDCNCFNINTTVMTHREFEEIRSTRTIRGVL